MLREIEKFFSHLLNEDAKETLLEREFEIACAALLVHCAMADGERSAEETKRITSVLGSHFRLSRDEVDSVIEVAVAQEREAVDLHRFTRVLHKHLDREERIRMVQLLWEIADTDGRINSEEQRMVSLKAKLLDVEVHDAVAARQAAKRAGGD